MLTLGGQPHNFLRVFDEALAFRDERRGLRRWLTATVGGQYQSAQHEGAGDESDADRPGHTTDMPYSAPDQKFYVGRTLTVRRGGGRGEKPGRV